MPEPSRPTGGRPRPGAPPGIAPDSGARNAVIAAVVVVALLVAAVVWWSLRTRLQEGSSATAVDEIGTEARCGPVQTEPASGSGEHVANGTTVDYAELGAAPPAYGPHLAEPAGFERKLYTADDRPPLEALVHNLEHGYTVLWYDEAVAADEQTMSTVEQIAQSFEGTRLQEDKFIAAPWTADDGAAFPEGMHVALTHWAAEGSDAAAGQGAGVRQYCAAPSGAAVDDFMQAYPWSNSMEPEAG